MTILAGLTLKGYQETLDFTLHHENKVLDVDAGETISSSSWAVTGGDGQLAIESSSYDSAGPATVWLSGGTDGQDYIVENTITTSEGRTYVRSILVRVVDT